MSITILKDENNNDLSSGIVAIHAALVPTSSGDAAIVYFGTEDQAWLYNVDTPNQPPVQLSTKPGWWAFCSAHAFLNDGRWVIAGGVVNQNITHHGHEDHDSGERRCEIYSPLAGLFSPIKDLNFQPGANYGGGRWYPTVLTLANGEVFAAAGHPFSGKEVPDPNDPNKTIEDTTGADDYVYDVNEGKRHNNNTPERYSPNKDSWTLLTAESTSHNNLAQDEYPRLHLAPSGHVFFSTIAKENFRFYDPYSGTYSGTAVSGGSADYHHGSGFTSVVLPILPNNSNIWVLACGAASTEKINITTNSPTWESAGTPPLAKQRVHACAVLLPTGSVFLNGGEVDGGPLLPQAELYHPPINWNQKQYNAGAGQWEAIEAPLVKRGYHSVALLMPDGRVWIAGSTWSDWAQNEHRMEVYTPPYIVPGRVKIQKAPPSVGYGASFEVRLSSSTSISRVVLIRCGSVTHAFDADQRYIVCNFEQNGDRLQVISPEGPGIAPPGNYMLFVLDSTMINGHGRPCERAAILRVCDQECTPVNNRSTYSKLEVDALKSNGTAVFTDAVWLFLENFRPHEANHPTAPTLTVFFDFEGGPAVDPNRFKLEPQNPWLEDDSLPPDIAQRFALRYDVRIHEDLYNDVNVQRDVVVRWDFGHFRCHTMLRLTTKPNPFMVDVAGGNVHWLSTDLRVFNIQAGGTTPTGAPSMTSNQAPLAYLQQVLTQYKNATNDLNHPFLKLKAGQDESALELRTQVGGKSVFNFAIAKVHYVAQGQAADNVRVFFRMFNTVGTALDFNSQTTYRRNGNGPNAVPLLGHIGPQIISIPFFEKPRVTPNQSMTAQPPDDARTIPAGGATEKVEYFGAWLDINQSDKHISQFWKDDGPFTSGFPFQAQSIFDLVRNYHQCLIAEIHFTDDPIPDAVDPNTTLPGTPANNDNLSQRNLAWVPVGNPGAAATRTAQTTFIARPSGGNLKETFMAESFMAQASVVFTGRPRRRGPDELIFDGRQVPRGSRVTVYMPDVDADEIINLAARRASPVRLSRIDAHTISFELRHVAYLPLPGGLTTPIIGLLSVELPSGVLKGERYRLVVHQLSGAKMSIIGTFQLEIPVFSEPALLESESIKLSVLRAIFRNIPTSDPWHTVFKRYLGEIADRVVGFGGDPDLIGPSPNGDAYPGGGGEVPQPGSGTDKEKEKEEETLKKFLEWTWKSVGWYRKSLVWLATAILAIFFLSWTIVTPVLLAIEIFLLFIALLGMALTIFIGVIAWYAASRWADASAKELDPAITDPNKKVYWHKEKLKWRKIRDNCDKTILITFLVGIVALTLYVLARLL